MSELAPETKPVDLGVGDVYPPAILLLSSWFIGSVNSGRRKESMSSDEKVDGAQRLARLCWAILFGVLAASTIILVVAIHCFMNKYAPRLEPLLSTPGTFTLLAIVIALSAYLRNVAGTADEKGHEIRSNEEPLYPFTTPPTAHTTKKLDALDKSYQRLQIGARFLIWLTIIITLRLLLESIARFGFYLSPNASYFRVLDLWILEWLVLALGVLSVMHYTGYLRDEEIRRSMLEWLKGKGPGGDSCN